MSNLKLSTLITPPTFKFSAIPTPPSTTNAPVVVEDDPKVELIFVVVIVFEISKLSVSRDILSTLSVTKESVSFDAPGALSAVMYVKPSTDLTPPSDPQVVPEYPSKEDVSVL